MKVSKWSVDRANLDPVETLDVFYFQIGIERVSGL
jgi:hypothetical protein